MGKNAERSPGWVNWTKHLISSSSRTFLQTRRAGMMHVIWPLGVNRAVHISIFRFAECMPFSPDTFSSQVAMDQWS
jgi:hypothetical protein